MTTSKRKPKRRHGAWAPVAPSASIPGIDAQIRPLPLLIAVLVLLALVGVTLWFAAATPYGNSVVVTIRSP